MARAPSSGDFQQPARPATVAEGAASRRRFLGVATAASAGLMVHSSLPAVEETQALGLGIIGCGGRGTGALHDSLSINTNVRVVAAADLYVEKCAALRTALEQHGDKVALGEGAMYGGLDAYRRVLDDPAVDIVIITAAGRR